MVVHSNLFSFQVIQSRSSQIFSKVTSMLIALVVIFAIVPQAMAEKESQNPNVVRGPIVTSIQYLRERYADDSFSGGVRFQSEVQQVIPRNGTLVATSCKLNLEVGMQVVALIAKPSGMPNVSVGDRGVVLSSAVTGEILVQWFGNHSGHDGMGNGALPKTANDGNSRWFVQCKEIALLPANDSSELIFNGGFELGNQTISNCSFTTHYSGSTAIPGWSVTAGNINRKRTPTSCPPTYPGWGTPDGEHSIDLDGDNSIGSIAQTVATTAGARYRLSFALTANCGSGPSTKRLSVLIDGISNEFECTCSTSPQVWSVKTFEFVALGAQTTILFKSLDPPSNSFGPMIDAVHLVASSGSLIDFVGLQQDENVLEFYNGGSGSSGSGPGADYGTSFSSDSRALYVYNGSNEPNPGLVATLTASNLSLNFNYAIQDISFVYTARVEVQVGFYSGLNGTGNLVNSFVLTPNTNGPSGNVYNTWSASSSSWQTDARSVVFTGTANRWGLDNISFVACPDSDGDGVSDCDDGCPNDPLKTAPGICGCGVADTDTDGDGTADCNDGCPNDPLKTAPGICGCGVADTDTDGDGIADCNDNCVLISNPGQEDCNGNLIGDACDIASGKALDCNDNNVPDSCDIASGTSADGDSDGIPDECEPTPAIQLVVIGSPSCVTAAGSEVSYDLQVINPPFGLVAGQFFVEWDTATFALNSVSAGDAPFTSIPFSSVNDSMGRVFLIASVVGGGTGTSESRTVARLHFQALSTNCSPTDPQVRFMAGSPQILTNGNGGSATLPLTNPIAVRIDGVPPVILGTPENITVDADAGSSCSSVQVITPPTASDNCTVVSFNFSRSDGQLISAPFPCGTTTMTWVATDSCGLSSTTSSTVTVNPFQAVMTQVQSNGATGNFQRCITFNIVGDGGATHTDSVELSFINGIAMTQLRVPFGDYDCVTADDRLHTLTQQTDLQVSGSQYSADFTGSKALLPGDLNNDNLVDVVDWGVLVTRIGQITSINTNCETPAFRADLNADGGVTSLDGDLLLDVILMTGQSCVSGAADSGDFARQSISVKELTEMGLVNAEECDLDKNGIVDLFDMLLWQQKNSQN